MNNQRMTKRSYSKRDAPVTAPLAALTTTVQPHPSGHLRPNWDGTPAHSSGFRPARADGGGAP
jgi:hypothetical protein